MTPRRTQRSPGCGYRIDRTGRRRHHEYFTFIHSFTELSHSCNDAVTSHPSCKPDDGSALFTVKVFFNGIESGTAVNVEPGGNETRPKLKPTDMGLELDSMGTAIGTTECKTMFGFHYGQFAVETAKIPKSSENFTFVTASFWNFAASDASGDVSIYSVIFGPGDDGVIDDEANWLPASGSNFLDGKDLRLDVQTGPAKKGPCDKLEISLDWKIVVTKQ